MVSYLSIFCLQTFHPPISLTVHPSFRASELVIQFSSASSTNSSCWPHIAIDQTFAMSLARINLQRVPALSVNALVPVSMLAGSDAEGNEHLDHTGTTYLNDQTSARNC
ncbi:hypothetical protein GALMADRAFT_229308 [Galerina marginata CBS 339.88]|uniref:Uncharacterized protein n=1 Tax=Galerina marginata (strain CBS 339.88) TaxID=685588 RepID=A0A067SP14_GALM3|nr:hypothetical protein GALMADRAFT_229308 [Galerina marginata CBS 339.88]